MNHNLSLIAAACFTVGLASVSMAIDGNEAKTLARSFAKSYNIAVDMSAARICRRPIPRDVMWEIQAGDKLFIVSDSGRYVRAFFDLGVTRASARTRSAEEAQLCQSSLGLIVKAAGIVKEHRLKNMSPFMVKPAYRSTGKNGMDDLARIHLSPVVNDISSFGQGNYLSLGFEPSSGKLTEYVDVNGWVYQVPRKRLSIPEASVIASKLLPALPKASVPRLQFVVPAGEALSERAKELYRTKVCRPAYVYAFTEGEVRVDAELGDCLGITRFPKKGNDQKNTSAK